VSIPSLLGRSFRRIVFNGTTRAHLMLLGLVAADGERIRKAASVVLAALFPESEVTDEQAAA
jgi:hypothetical protein